MIKKKKKMEKLLKIYSQYFVVLGMQKQSMVMLASKNDSNCFFGFAFFQNILQNIPLASVKRLMTIRLCAQLTSGFMEGHCSNIDKTSSFPLLAAYIKGFSLKQRLISAPLANNNPMTFTPFPLCEIESLSFLGCRQD